MKTERSVFKSIVNFFIDTHAPKNPPIGPFHAMTTIECHRRIPRPGRSRSPWDSLGSTDTTRRKLCNCVEQFDQLRRCGHLYLFLPR